MVTNLKFGLKLLMKKGTLMFESDLYKLCQHLGRPVLEFQGARVDAPGDDGLCWLIESSI